MIERIEIENYKSIEKVSLPLKRLNVLVGANAAGKSNLVDALQFLHEAISSLSTPGAMLRSRWGYSRIVHKFEKNRKIAIGIANEVDPQQEGGLEYILVLGCCREDDAQVASETVLLQKPGESDAFADVLLVRPSNSIHGDVQVRNVDGSLEETSAPREMPWLTTAFDRVRYPDLFDLRVAICQWAFYNFYPPAMKESVPARGGERLDPKGEILAAVLHAANVGSPESFAKATEYVQALLPGTKSVLTPIDTNGKTYVGIQDPVLGKVPAPCLSDGTMGVLGLCALLCAEDPPGLICIEEPENFVHPRDLGLVADLLRDIAARSQVIVSTHSPHLLDHFDLEAPDEQVVIVEKHDGATVCKPLAPSDALREALKETPLGEIWYSGAIGGVPER